MIEYMNFNSLHTKSFAYPQGESNSEIDSTLFSYFQILRKTTYEVKDPENLECYFSGKALVYGIGIDNSYSHFSNDYIFELIAFAKAHNRRFILHAHKPVREATANYEVDINLLESICKFAQDNHITFLTLSDLVPLIE